LLRATKEPKVKSKDLKSCLGRPWRTVSTKVLKQYQGAIEELGWQYVQGLGRSGSYFMKTQTSMRNPNTGILSQFMN
jgi:hypothetical protein